MFLGSFFNFRKKQSESVWNKFGELIPKSKFDFSSPNISVSSVGGVLLYEKHYRVNGKFMVAALNMETRKTEKISVDQFNGLYTDLNAFFIKGESFITLETDKGLVLGRYEGGVATEDSFMKKSVAKKSSNVRDVFYDGSHFVMIHDVDGKIAQSKFIESKQKWETVIEEDSDVDGDHYLSDHSIVEFNVPNPTPLLHRYNGKSWNKAEVIGSKEVYGCYKYEIVKCGDTFYHAYELNSGLVIESFK